MKQETRLTALAVITIMLLVLNIRGIGSALRAKDALSAKPDVGSNVDGTPFDYKGKIEAINGNLWMVSGKPIAVSPQVVGGIPFRVGDAVHMTGIVAKTGVIAITRVESLIFPPPLVFSPSSRVKGSTSSSMPGSSGPSGSYYDDQELYGTVEAINGDQITIDGVTYTLGYDLVYSDFSVGDMVKFEFFTSAGGTMTITDIESSSSMGSHNSNSSYNGNNNSSYNENSNDDDDEDENENEDDDDD